MDETSCLAVPSRRLVREGGLPLPLVLPRPRPQRRGHTDVVGEVTILDDIVPTIRFLLVLIASKKYAPKHSIVLINSPGQHLDPSRRLDGRWRPASRAIAAIVRRGRDCQRPKVPAQEMS